MTSKQYIATQGPLPTTIEDFWRLVWEQRCSAIVMLTHLVEGDKVRKLTVTESHCYIMCMILQNKCSQYWPDPHINRTLVFGDFIVTVGNIQVKSNYLITTLHLQHKDVSQQLTTSFN